MRREALLGVRCICAVTSSNCYIGLLACSLPPPCRQEVLHAPNNTSHFGADREVNSNHNKVQPSPTYQFCRNFISTQQ